MTPVEIAQLTATVTLITAIVSSITALTVTLIGQRLTRKSNEEADRRRWQREESARWQIRSEEMAREAVDRLREACELVGWSGGRQRAVEAGLESQWVAPDLSAVVTAVSPVRRAALEIGDPRIREHLASASELLVNGRAADIFGAAHAPRLAWAVQQTSEELIGAYLRGEPLSRSSDEEVIAEHWRLFREGVDAVEMLHNGWDESE